MLKSTGAKSVIAAFLASVLFLAGGAGTAFAAEISVHREILNTGVEAWSPEYYALAEMWNKYYLDLLPDSSQPEVLQRLTIVPAYDDLDEWKEYFHDGDSVLMRDEAFAVAKKLGVDNSSLSYEEKVRRIVEWRNDWASGFQQSVFGRVDLLGKVYGHVYDCTTQSEGPVTLCRIAGIPAISLGMGDYGVRHEEAFFYDGSVWRHITGMAYYDFFRDIDAYQVNGLIEYSPESVYGLERQPNGTAVDNIIDLNESWIDWSMERFMLVNVLKQPYVYPEKKLTRGETAKLLCNYAIIIPMRNEQVFADVPTAHKYSAYIWALNKLGIMGGVGDGKFNPDAELTMQEFAVIAMRVLEYGGDRKVAYIKEDIERIKNNPTDWPPELAYTKNAVADLEKSLDWKSGIQITNPIVFADSGKIASWAKPAVDEFSRFGILQGDNNTNPSLNPTEPLSKTRFLVFLYKFEQKFRFSGNIGNILFES
jgi:hypothetical protein